MRTAGGNYYYLFDGHGSVLGLTDGAGNLVSNFLYRYDPYGVAQRSCRSIATSPASKASGGDPRGLDSSA